MADDDDRDPSIEAALRLAAPDQTIDTRDIVAHTPQPTWWQNEVDRARRAYQGGIGMLHNSEAGLAQGNEEAGQRFADFAHQYLGAPSPPSPEALNAVTMLLGGVKAPGQPVRIANPIKAYHGSPHDFNEFDLSKIGTGEGAQAYGHGLYFAESEPVARSYRDALAPRRTTTRLGPGGSYILDELPPQGRMYEVALHATPESFLDWDKPIGAQPDAIANALHENWLAHRDAHANQSVGAFLHALEREHGADITRGPNLSANAQATDKLREAGIPGVRYLDQGSRFNPASLPKNPMTDEARHFLEQAGGDSATAVKLFHQSNPVERWAVPERDQIQKVIESAGRQQTHNYSVWSPEIIEILRKYGIIGPTAAGALMSQYGNKDQQ